MHKPVLLSSTLDIASGSFRVEGFDVEGQGFLTLLELSEGQQDALHALAYVAAGRTWKVVWENVFTSTLLSSIQGALMRILSCKTCFQSTWLGFKFFSVNPSKG